MKRLLLLSSLFLVMTFAGTMLLIRAQPYDDAELRTFLIAPDDCPAPCFMGIQPGVTTVDEAMTILRGHEWVAEVSITDYNRLGLQRIEWRWQQGASPMLEAAEIPRSGGRLTVDSGIVQYMEVLTRIRAGEVWLLLGQAQYYTSLFQLGPSYPRPPKPITVIYPNLIFIAGTECPYKRNFWNAYIEVVVAQSREWLQDVAAYPIVMGAIPINLYVHELDDEDCPPQP